MKGQEPVEDPNWPIEAHNGAAEGLHTSVAYLHHFDEDPGSVKSRMRIRIKVKSRIRIRIKGMRICNTGSCYNLFQALLQIVL